VKRGKPRIVEYLYIHQPGEEFDYPTSRSGNGTARTAVRYLECALVQAASLLARDVDCEVALVTNLTDMRAIGRRGARLVAAAESLGVELVFAEYRNRPRAELPEFMSSQYVFDAIVAASDPGDPDQVLWLMDADCVWFDPRKVLAAAPPSPGIGCVHIPYPPDWDICGLTPQEVGELARDLGAPDASIRWVGGELLTGTAGDLRALVATCKALEREVVDAGFALYTEEHLLSLAGALGRASFSDLSSVARRVLTGPRHKAPVIEDPLSIGLWHLPSEKGLGFRRSARAILSGHVEQLVSDLDVPSHAMKRFNISGAGWPRRVRDDAWLARQRVRDGVLSRLAPRKAQGLSR
jgi:hypothetical protein